MATGKPASRRSRAAKGEPPSPRAEPAIAESGAGPLTDGAPASAESETAIGQSGPPALPKPEPASPHYRDDLATLYLGDCLAVMAGLDADSIDAVVTDPPYGLEFMGKEWDKFRVDPRAARWSGENSGGAGAGFGQRVDNGRATTLPAYHSRRTTARCNTCGKRDAFRNPHKCGDAADWEIIPVDVVPIEARAFGEWCRLWAVEAYRITRPGGYLLAFGGTRTHHRLVVGIEDAGWIIRDELDWIYASGFPKSRASLKPAREPIVLARKPGPARPLNIDDNRLPISAEDAALIDGAGGFMKAGWQGPDTGIYNKSGDPTVGHTPRSIGPTGVSQENKPPRGDRDNIIYGHGLGVPDPEAAVGRWPSNVLLSSPELFDEPNPYVIGSGTDAPGMAAGILRRGATNGHGIGLGSTAEGGDVVAGYGDRGGPARFFIVPKADRNDREPVVRGQLAASEIVFEAHPNNPRCLRCELPRIGALGAPACECAEPEWAPVGDRPRENMHPTVKPTDLMRHLVRLVTPPGGLVLDPFLGSGSTLLAANAEGYRCIGIERDPESLAVTRARMAGHELGLGLDVAAPSRPPAKAGRFTGKRHGGEFWTDKTWAQDGLGLDAPEAPAAPAKPVDPARPKGGTFWTDKAWGQDDEPGEEPAG